MDLTFTQEEEAFRQEAREWISANLPDEFKTSKTRATRTERDIWYKRLAEKGWLCASWPKDAGGPGWSLAKQFIFKSEAAAQGAPPGDMGLSMVGPMMIEYASEEQKQRFLPKIAQAEEMWCQGYSEPNAGSDLASLQLRAVRDGDDFVLNGQKIWTSYAAESDWIFILARTDLSAKKQQEGISFLVSPIDAPGIEIRPIQQITGESEFFETFFTDVRVPVANLIGQENGGWTLGKRLLAHERVSTGGGAGYRQSLEKLTRLANKTKTNGHYAIDDNAIRQRIAELHIELDALDALGYRGLTQLLHGDMPGPESSVMKVYGTELFQKITDLALEIQGPLSQVWWDDENLRDETEGWTKTAAWSRAFTIFSGTSEIQRNIISERVLGLPRG